MINKQKEWIENKKARTYLSVITSVTKAVTAPTNIIPSTPKFRTPDLSVMSSPQDAKIKGTAEAMIDVIISPTKFMSIIIFLNL